MINVARTPLTSPAIRTVISSSSNASYPFHHALPSSALTHLHKTAGPGSPRGYHRMSPSVPAGPGSPTSAGYFHLVATPRLPLSPRPPTSPAPEIVVHTPKVPTREVNSAKKPETFKSSVSETMENMALSEKGDRRRPSFCLPELPNPSTVWGDSFQALADLGDSCELPWSDSFDSIETLKPTKGRVATPYPRLEGEWITD